MDSSIDIVRRIIPSAESYFMVPVVSTYIGPGDTVSGALGWWGLRAYSSATINTNCCDIIRASDSATQTFKTLANGDIDLASIAAFLAATTGSISKLYDQSGNGNDLVQASVSNQLTFEFSVIGSRPALGALDVTFSRAVNNGAAPGPFPQPFTYSNVSERIGSFTTETRIQGDAVFGLRTGYSATTNVGFMQDNSAGTQQTFPASNSTVHALQAVFNGASSVAYIDGTSNATNVGADTGTGMSFGGSINNVPVYVWECGIWSIGFDPTQQSNMNSNQHLYWGF